MGKKSKTTTGPSKAALPHMNAATNAVNQAYAGNQGNLAAIGGQLGDLFRQYTAGIGKDPLMGAAKGYATDVLGGKYLGEQNPYLNDMIEMTGENVSDQVNSIFGRAGMVGSSRYGGEMTKQLSNAENTLRYQNYSDEMDRMAAAAGLVPSLNAAENSDIATALGLGSAAAEIPYLGADFLAKNLGGLWGNSTTTTQKQGLGSTLAGLAGAGLSGWATGGFKL